LEINTLCSNTAKKCEVVKTVINNNNNYNNNTSIWISVVNGNVHVESFITTRRGRGERANKQKRWKRESNQEERSMCGAAEEPHCTGLERAFFS